MRLSGILCSRLRNWFLFLVRVVHLVMNGLRLLRSGDLLGCCLCNLSGVAVFLLDVDDFAEIRNLLQRRHAHVGHGTKSSGDCPGTGHAKEMLGNSWMAILRVGIPHVGEDLTRLGKNRCLAECHVTILRRGKL